MKDDVEDLMNKLYKCGKVYKDNVSVGILKDYWDKTLTDNNGILLTKILYGELKTKYKKRTRTVDIDHVHDFSEKETIFNIKDLNVVINWADGHREDNDNVMNFVRFFIRSKKNGKD